MLMAALVSSGVSGAEAPLGQAGFTGGSTAAAWEGHAGSLRRCLVCEGVSGIPVRRFLGGIVVELCRAVGTKCSVRGAINSRCCRAVGLLTAFILSTSCPITHLILIITVKH